MCFEDCRDLVWKSADDKTKYTRLLGFTEQIPSEMIMVRRDLSQAVKDRLLSLLSKRRVVEIFWLKFHKELQITGFRGVDETTSKHWSP